MSTNLTATIFRIWISTLVASHSGIWVQRSGVLSTYLIQESEAVDAKGIQGPRCRLCTFSPLEPLAFHLPSLLFPNVYKATLEFLAFHFRSALSLSPRLCFWFFPAFARFSLRLFCRRCVFASLSSFNSFLWFCFSWRSFVCLGFWTSKPVRVCCLFRLGDCSEFCGRFESLYRGIWIVLRCFGGVLGVVEFETFRKISSKYRRSGVFISLSGLRCRLCSLSSTHLNFKPWPRVSCLVS